FSIFCLVLVFFFFFQAEDGIRDFHVTGVLTCALPISIYYNYSNGIFMSSTHAQIKDYYISAGASGRVSYHFGKGLYGGFSYAPDFVKYADYGNRSEYNATYGLDLRFKF